MNKDQCERAEQCVRSTLYNHTQGYAECQRTASQLDTNEISASYGDVSKWIARGLKDLNFVPFRIKVCSKRLFRG